MSGVSFNFTISNMPEAQALAETMLARSKDTQPLMEAIALSGEGSTRRRIEQTNVSPEGVAWKPSIRVKAQGGKTLFEHGALAGSIVSEGTAEEAVWGTNLIKARILQLGGIILPKTAKALRFRIGGAWRVVKKVVMPARPFFGASEADRKDWLDLTIDFFTPPAPGVA